MSSSIYKWQGEPVEVRWGHSKVMPSKEKVLMWYNYECYISQNASEYASVPSVEITTRDGSVFYIANHFGIGGHKLFNGGWPSHAHFSIPGDSDFDEETQLRVYKRLREEDYAAHESKREKFFKENYGHTEDYKKSQALKEMIRRGRGCRVGNYAKQIKDKK